MNGVLPVQGTAESLEAQIRDLQAELGTDLTAQLSAAEKTELKRLVPRLEKLKVRREPSHRRHLSPQQCAVRRGHIGGLVTPRSSDAPCSERRLLLSWRRKCITCMLAGSRCYLS